MITATVCTTVLALAGTVKPYAVQNHLNLTTVLAVIATESGGNPNAMRYEAHYYDAYIKRNPTYLALSQRYGVRGVSSSIGLFQIMPTTAWSIGFKGSPYDLLRPATNMQIGTRYLGQLKAKYGEFNALRAYNAGEGGMLKGRGHGYAMQVMKWKGRLQRQCF